jgi:hypothetical protein
MLRATELAGLLGVALAAGAYVPQIWHLIHEHCAAGVSRFAFTVWLLSSLLVASHAIAIGAAVFIVLGVVQVVATGVIVVFATKYQHSLCATHLLLSAPTLPSAGGG